MKLINKLKIRRLKKVRDSIDPNGDKAFLCHKSWWFFREELLCRIEKHAPNGGGCVWFYNNNERINAIDKVIEELKK